MSSFAEKQHRADIDGLRAIAVLPVVLFHCGLSAFSGGYVGVDVFFVISGFLITGIIQRELDTHTFSLLRFYERRIRRIVPALATVVIFVLVACSLFMLPNDLKGVGTSAGATVLFVSNFYFYSSIDYFAATADLRPLLHTWSLAVEEQYYIFFPLLLIAIARWCPKAKLPLLLLLAALSLMISVVQTDLNATAAFYLPFSRMWELLAGSLLAIAPQQVLARMQAPVSGLIGIAMIVAAIFLFDEATAFPSYNALLPVVGAVLVLGCGSGPVAAVLGQPPMRWVGNISYSLYLWHWPLLAIFRYHFGLYIDGLPILLLLACMFVAAYLSYRFIEQPWRTQRQFWTRKRVFVGAGALASICLIGAASTKVVDKVYNRFPADARPFVAGAVDINPLRPKCDSLSVAKLRNDEVCTIGAAVAPSFALVGDSIGDALSPGVEAAAIKAGKSGYVLTNAGCSPLLGVKTGGAKCKPAFDEVFAFLDRHPNVRTILLAGRWAPMVEGKKFGEEMKTRRFMADAETVTPSYEENYAVFNRSFDRMGERLKGRQVFVLAYVPEQPIHVSRILAMQAIRGDKLSSGITAEQHLRRNRNTEAVLEALADKWKFRIIDMGRWACNQRECPIIDAEGRSTYFDDNHPTATFAKSWAAAYDGLL